MMNVERNDEAGENDGENVMSDTEKELVETQIMYIETINELEEYKACNEENQQQLAENQPISAALCGWSTGTLPLIRVARPAVMQIVYQLMI